MNKGNRPHADKRRAHPINSPETEPAIETDENFLAHHPNRCFWVRPLSRADKQFIEHAGSKLELPSAGMKWFVVVCQVLPNQRMKVVFQAPTNFNTGASETICRALYSDLTSPEKIALSDNLELLLRNFTHESARDGGEN